MLVDLNFISWQSAILILLIVIFLLWATFGGGDYEYIGLKPLELNNRDTEYKIEEIDNTPEIPDLDNFEYSGSYESYSGSYGSGSYGSGSYESYGGSYESEENTQIIPPIIQTPRTAALGPHKCRVNGKISKGEMLCKRAIEDIYGLPFYCVRPDFLKNPETGRNLEIDIYNDQLKIGVEYSGEQHFVFPNTFHRTYEDFISQIRRDHYKIDACDAHGIYLITVPYNVKCFFNEPLCEQGDLMWGDMFILVSFYLLGRIYPGYVKYVLILSVLYEIILVASDKSAKFIIGPLIAITGYLLGQL